MTAVSRIKKWFRVLGPGFVTGAADDDPSGIATYTQTGAMFGYGQAWMAVFTFPFMTVVQEMCGRIGLVTGKGLAGVMKQHYSKTVLYLMVLLLFLANTINVGANLGAMASTLRLLVPLPFTVLLALVVVLTLVLEIFVSYETYAKYLKFLAMSLLAYIAAAFMVKINWYEVGIATLTPRIGMSTNYWINIVAVLGTTISPYLFFWQANQEVEEEISKGKILRFGWGTPRVNKGDIKRMGMDTVVGMFFSNIVMFFIIVTAAVTLNAAGITDIQTADQAALALRPLAGEMSFLLFTLGIVGTGLLSVPVLAGSASYAVAEMFGWKTGLNRKFNQARGFYGAIIVATLLGLLVNYMGIPPFKVLYYTAVINGLVAPVILVMVMLIANNEKVMGAHKNGIRQNVIGWAITGLMGVAGLVLIAELVLRYF